MRLDNGAGTTRHVQWLGEPDPRYNENEGGHRNAEGNYTDGEVRVGSHNLVVGAGHTYGSNGSLLGGYNNALLDKALRFFLGKRAWPREHGQPSLAAWTTGPPRPTRAFQVGTPTPHPATELPSLEDS